MPDLLSLGSSSKPVAGLSPYRVASTRHGGQPVMETEAPVGMKQVLRGQPRRQGAPPNHTVGQAPEACVLICICRG